ncbi:MAG: RES domain-containing protein [Puniceicoccaceae bacterium 5H]|nr:MAG: RES domain-containing protein [Puniceicoccaceae bacterium 5H]
MALRRFAATPEDAFGGKGGLYAAGRWNRIGRPIVYTAEHLSLCALEILVHLQRGQPMQPFVWWRIAVPDGAVKDQHPLPPELERSREVGHQWLERRSSPVLRVPSLLIPGEHNLLLNPLHPAFDQGWIQQGPEPFSFDARLTP